MAQFAGKNWKKEELLGYVGSASQLAGVWSSRLDVGKGDGLRCFDINTGSGLTFKTVPGRGMDIPEMHFKGMPLHFASGTGITSPSYFEEGGLEWLRSFFVGTLTTCGITNAGAPSTDEGREFGLHGRISNTGAENLSITQEWVGDEYRIAVEGTMRESMAMFENVELRRRISTSLGRRGFTWTDRVTNNGFESQPLMLVYHFNAGFPLLAPGCRMLTASAGVVDRDTNGEVPLDATRSIAEPVTGIGEKVYFHSPLARPDGKSVAMVVNRDIGNGEALGLRLTYDTAELPKFTQWVINRKGFYAAGLEPGTVSPHGRGVLRERGELPFLEGMETRTFTLDVDVTDNTSELDEWEREVTELCGRSGRQ